MHDLAAFLVWSMSGYITLDRLDIVLKQQWMTQKKISQMVDGDLDWEDQGHFLSKYISLLDS